jgi:prepilin-type N-terminal cleavage/methylation domain-containing protein
MKIVKGFSLLEILTVLAIFVVLSGIAVSSMTKWINRAKVKSFAEKLLSDIQGARSLSLKYGSSRVRFFPNKYQIYAPPDVLRKSVETPQGITISENFGSTLNFYVNTLPAKNGTVTITGFGKTYKIVINLNGEVRLE